MNPMPNPPLDAEKIEVEQPKVPPCEAWISAYLNDEGEWQFSGVWTTRSQAANVVVKKRTARLFRLSDSPPPVPEREVKPAAPASDEVEELANVISRAIWDMEVGTGSNQHLTSCHRYAKEVLRWFSSRQPARGEMREKVAELVRLATQNPTDTYLPFDEIQEAAKEKYRSIADRILSLLSPRGDGWNEAIEAAARVCFDAAKAWYMVDQRHARGEQSYSLGSLIMAHKRNVSRPAAKEDPFDHQINPDWKREATSLRQKLNAEVKYAVDCERAVLHKRIDALVAALKCAEDGMVRMGFKPTKIEDLDPATLPPSEEDDGEYHKPGKRITDAVLDALAQRIMCATRELDPDLMEVEWLLCTSGVQEYWRQGARAAVAYLGGLAAEPTSSQAPA